MILTLIFTDIYWERTSSITIKEKDTEVLKKTENSELPSVIFYAVRPRSAVCSCQSLVEHASERVSIDTELFCCD